MESGRRKKDILEEQVVAGMEAKPEVTQHFWLIKHRPPCMSALSGRCPDERQWIVLPACHRQDQV